MVVAGTAFGNTREGIFARSEVVEKGASDGRPKSCDSSCFRIPASRVTIWPVPMSILRGLDCFKYEIGPLPEIRTEPTETVSRHYAGGIHRGPFADGLKRQAVFALMTVLNPTELGEK
jgi:hypothetical protein